MVIKSGILLVAPRGTLARKKSEGKTGEELTETVHQDFNFFGIKTTFTKVASDHDMKVSTLIKRYNKGLRDAELVQKGRLNSIPYNGDKITFKALAKLTGLSVTLLSKRYLDGLRGDDLVKPAPIKKHVPVKLTASIVKNIKRDINSELFNQRQLANKYNVSVGTISGIKCEIRWKEVTI
jgi:hypothetical protein